MSDLPSSLRIAYVAAGAANMYCGSCLHDNTLAAALIRSGHEVTLIPTYTPLRTDEDGVAVDRIFYGGINVFLKGKWRLFRRSPRFLDALLESRWLLNWVSRFSSATDPEDLGALTVSMLEGEEGSLKSELFRLVQWLRSAVRPQLIHLTNSMMLGLAPALKRELNVPVVCSLQGEDLFLDALHQPYRQKALSAIQRHSGAVEAFVATSQYYADFMSQYLNIERSRIHVVHPGIRLDGHGLAAEDSPRRFTVGYLARVCREKGLHLLVDAFLKLVKEHGTDAVELRVAGYLDPKDRAYLRELKARIARLDPAPRFSYWGEVDLRQKIAFLNSLDVLSVPTSYREPKGRFVIEALANAVPVVQPAHGAFVELIELTGGGVLVEPGSSESLARALEELWQDPARRKFLGQRGQAAVARHLSDEAMAQATLRVYRRCLEGF